RHVKSTHIIGVITGQQELAAKIADDYTNNKTMITERLAKANFPKPRIYTEFGAAGLNEIAYTYGNICGARL
ncbi:iron ABC transporter substrate-binding protein, partial [Marinomonas arenicola]